MMEFIAHRINTIDELKEVPTNFGVEIDLRDWGSRIILQHDPFKAGEDFEEYLEHYKHGTMILNIKSERIEFRVLDLLKEHNVTNYFFLDSSFPMIYQLSEMGERNLALRFSEFEGLDTLIAMQGRATWVWVDCFTRFPLDKQISDRIHEQGFNICLVSPELQGRPGDITEYRNLIKRHGLKLDAICSKIAFHETWIEGYYS